MEWPSLSHFMYIDLHFLIYNSLPFALFQKMMCCLNCGILLKIRMNFTTDIMNTSKLCEMCCTNRPFFKKFFLVKNSSWKSFEIWNALSPEYLILLLCPNGYRLISGAVLTDMFCLALHYYLGLVETTEF